MVWRLYLPLFCSLLACAPLAGRADSGSSGVITTTTTTISGGYSGPIYSGAGTIAGSVRVDIAGGGRGTLSLRVGRNAPRVLRFSLDDSDHLVFAHLPADLTANLNLSTSGSVPMVFGSVAVGDASYIVSLTSTRPPAGAASLAGQYTMTLKEGAHLSGIAALSVSAKGHVRLLGLLKDLSGFAYGGSLNAAGNIDFFTASVPTGTLVGAEITLPSDAQGNVSGAGSIRRAGAAAGVLSVLGSRFNLGGGFGAAASWVLSADVTRDAAASATVLDLQPIRSARAVETGGATPASLKLTGSQGFVTGTYHSVAGGAINGHPVLGVLLQNAGRAEGIVLDHSGPAEFSLLANLTVPTSGSNSSSGGLVITSGGSLSLSGGTANVAGNGGIRGGTLVLSGGNGNYLGGLNAITIAQPVNVTTPPNTFMGGGTLTLTGTSTWAGTTTVNSGATGAGVTTVGSGSVILGSVNYTGGSTLQISAGSGNVLTGTGLPIGVISVTGWLQVGALRIVPPQAPYPIQYKVNVDSTGATITLNADELLAFTGSTPEVFKLTGGNARVVLPETLPDGITVTVNGDPVTGGTVPVPATTDGSLAVVTISYTAPASSDPGTSGDGTGE